MIEVNVLKNGVTLNETERLTSGSVNVYHIHFHFSSHWDGLEKVAVFRTPLTSVNVPVSVDDIAVMPWEVTTTVGLDVRMGVCGIKAGEIVLPTVWTTLGKVVEGAKIADAESGDHTPDIYDLILSKIQEFVDGLKSIDEKINFVHDEIPTRDEIISIVVNYLLERPDTIYPVIKKYLTENQIQIEGDIKELISNYFATDPSVIEQIIKKYLTENESAIGDVINQYFESNPTTIEEVVKNYLTEHPPGIEEATVEQVINNYFEQHPVETLTPDQVNNIIQQYLSENSSDIYQIIQNYLTENPVGITEERVQQMIDETVGSAINSGY